MAVLRAPAARRRRPVHGRGRRGRAGAPARARPARVLRVGARGHAGADRRRPRGGPGGAGRAADGAWRSSSRPRTTRACGCWRPTTPTLATARAVADVALPGGGHGGRPRRPGGARRRDRSRRVEFLRERLRRRLTVTAVAETDDGLVAVRLPPARGRRHRGGRRGHAALRAPPGPRRGGDRRAGGRRARPRHGDRLPVGRQRGDRPRLRAARLPPHRHGVHRR